MSFDSPAAGPGPRWTGDGSLRPRVPLPEDDPASPAHRSSGDVVVVAKDARIRTVEFDGVAAVLASPLRRLVGMSIDLMLRSLLLTFLLMLSGADTSTISLGVIVAAQILSRGWDAIFFTQGWTPGSRIMRIRIVRLEDGRAPGPRRGVARAAGAILSETPLWLGYAWALRDPRYQTWHDKIARTVVVEVPR